MPGILDFVPDVLRGPITDSPLGPEQTASLLLSISSASHPIDLSSAHHFLIGALGHQKKVADKSPTFAAYIDDIKVVKKFSKTSKALLGVKHEIHYTSFAKNKESKSEFLQTGWYSYYGPAPENNTFEVSLARTITAIARFAMENEHPVFLRKTYEVGETKHAKEGKVKFLGDIGVENYSDASLVDEIFDTRKILAPLFGKSDASVLEEIINDGDGEELLAEIKDIAGYTPPRRLLKKLHDPESLALEIVRLTEFFYDTNKTPR